MVAPADRAAAIDRAFGYEMSIEGILTEMDTGQVDLTSAMGADEGYSHPVVRLVNAFLLDAVKLGASDLHFEPEESFVRLRYRVDGVMHEVRTLHKDYWAAISQRTKIMSEMNSAHTFTPPHGRSGAPRGWLIGVAVALFDAILFGEGEEITEVSVIFSMLALSIAVTHAVLSLILSAELMGRGVDAGTSSFSDDSPWRRPVEWTTVVLVPVSLIGALIFGVVAWSLA